MTAVDCHFIVEGDGPPVFFIHGIGASHQVWDDVVDELRPRYRCVRCDLRGHGRSPVPRLPYTLEDLVADLERLREIVQVERAHFVGHSLGGMIAAAYARAYPQRVVSLGLLSTAAGRTEEDTAKVLRVVAVMEEQGIEAVLSTLSERWFTSEFSARHPDVVQRRRQQVLECDPRVFLSVFRVYAETEMGPWLHELQAPALVLTGEQDGGCTPRMNAFIAGQIPVAELVVLEGLRHAILLEAPQQVAAHLGRFLEQQPGI